MKIDLEKKVSLAGIMIYLLFNLISSFGSSFLKVSFLDVGQGDSILIESPCHKRILVDGGENAETLYSLADEIPFGSKKIDIVVLTHPHLDHIGGLIDVIRFYDISEVWLNPVVYESLYFEIFLKYVCDKDISIKLVENTFSIDIDGVRFRVLWPVTCQYSGEYGINDAGLSTSISMNYASKGMKTCQISRCLSFDENVNNDSIVLLVTFGDFNLLLMGDAENEVESELLSSTNSLEFDDIDVLKAGHHCSKTASSQAFLEKTNPDLVICSCGKDNKFGHPHEETLETFDSLDIDYLRTDFEGTIRVKTDGLSWQRY
ncbi:MBL fold metallo-hydrolase [Candidatus Dojkabacteria bacterium]|nr:MBL fold metallo-hydrolase [Candidatus Dojkabacteria bacterium]